MSKDNFLEESSQYINIELKVNENEAGWRLDRFILRHLPRLSRTKLKKIFEKDRIISLTPQRKPTPSLIVHPGEIYIIKKPLPKENNIIYPPEIIFEDKWLVVINKPPFMAVHPSSKYYKTTLTYFLKNRYSGKSYVQITHRLDRETSGIVVCAKDPEVERKIKAQFAKKRIKKWYIAVVHGVITKDEFKIDLPLARSSTSLVRIKMVPDPKGVKAITFVKTIKKFDNYTLVEAIPITGRQHQIRAHLMAIGHPIVGDKIYIDETIFTEITEKKGNSEEIKDRLILPRQALHAWKIYFIHPITLEPLTLEAPLFPDLKEFIAQLEKFHCT